MLYVLLKYLHVLAAVFLFGFGMGSYLYLIAAHRSGEPLLIAHTARQVVRFDTWITTPAGVLQLLTGLAMAHLAGWPMAAGWLRDALVVFLLVGLAWLPVLLLQSRLQRLAQAAAAGGEPLGSAYARLYRPWFWLGVWGFAGMFVITLLMVSKRSLAGWLAL